MIGSVHFLRDGAVDMDDEWDVWGAGESAEHVWRRYFETRRPRPRARGLYDIMAHPDLVKVWGRERPWPDGDLRRYYEPAVEAFLEVGVAVEVSTAGLRKPVGEIYPSRRVPGDGDRRRPADRAVQRRPRARPARPRLRRRRWRCSRSSACARSACSRAAQRRMEPLG